MDISVNSKKKYTEFYERIYHCGNCGKFSIMEFYKFCPLCGAEINWIPLKEYDMLLKKRIEHMMKTNIKNFFDFMYYNKSWHICYPDTTIEIEKDVIKDFKKTLNNTSKNLYKRIHKKIDVEELFRSIIEEKRI
jgi:hypothetical protein